MDCVTVLLPGIVTSYFNFLARDASGAWCLSRAARRRCIGARLFQQPDEQRAPVAEDHADLSGMVVALCERRKPINIASALSSENTFSRTSPASCRVSCVERRHPQLPAAAEDWRQMDAKGNQSSNFLLGGKPTRPFRFRMKQRARLCGDIHRAVTAPKRPRARNLSKLSLWHSRLSQLVAAVSGTSDKDYIVKFCAHGFHSACGQQYRRKPWVKRRGITRRQSGKLQPAFVCNISECRHII